MPKLDRRLQAILDNIPAGSRIIDIGCDHGKIPVQAVLSGKAISAVATDISPKSLEKTVRLSEICMVSDKIVTRCGDGLKVINEEEGDTLIIAGMGAREIIEILKESKISFNTYIFVPHRESVRLREYLSDNGFFIFRDYKVKSGGKYYDIMVGRQGERKLSYKELMLGQSSLENQDYIDFLSHEKDKIQRLSELKPYDLKNIKYLNLIKEVLNENTGCN